MKLSHILKIIFTIIATHCSVISIAGDPQIPLVNSGEAIQEGLELYEKEKYSEAIEKFLLVPRNDTNYITAQYEAALAFTKLDSFNKSIEICKKALEMPSDDEVGLMMIMGASYDQMGKFEKAIEVYSEAIKKFPYNNKLWFELGVVYGNQDNDTAAMRCFKKSISMNLFHPGSHLQLGLLAARNNHFTEALLSLQMFLLLENTTQRSYQVLAIAETMAKGNFEVKMDSIVDIGTGNTFEEIEEIIRSKSALRAEYKTKVKLSYLNLVKTLQVVNEKLSYNAGDKNYWMQTYAQYFVELRKNDHFEPFVYHVFASVDDEDSKSEIKKNKSKIEDMILWSSKFLEDNFPRENFIVNGSKMKGLPAFYDNGQLKYIGNIDPVLKKEIGDFLYFHRTGNKKSEGKYNGKGERVGKWPFYYPSGGVKEEYNYENGNVTGPYVMYYENGVIKEKANIVKGSTDGLKENYFPGGNISVSQNMVNGVNNGKANVYFKNGRLKKELNLANGEYDGDYKEYYSNGNPRYMSKFTRGKENGNAKRYYESGALEMEGNVINDENDGEFKFYHENGKLMKQGTYKAGKPIGVWKEYYENGKPETEYNYSNGLLDGITTDYDDDGVKVSERVYGDGKLKKYKYFDKSGKIVSQGEESGGTLKFVGYYPDGITKTSEGSMVKGKLTGNWIYYYSNGQKKSEEKYVDDNYNGERRTYFRNGILKSIENYKDDKLEGYYTLFYKNNNKEEEGWFVEDQRQGVWKSYHPNGTIRSSMYYLNDERKGFAEYYDTRGRLDYEQYLNSDDVFAMTVGYDTLGKVISNAKIDKGTGEYKTVFMNGKPRFEGFYKYGNREGKWVNYFSNGKPSYTLNYSGGDKSGLSTNYFDNGNKKSVSNFKNDEIDSVYQSYFENGKSRYECIYSNGDVEGKDTWFYDSGKPMRVGNYLHDEKDGYFYYYSTDGMERMRAFFKDGVITGYAYKDKSGNYVPEIPIINETAHVVAYYQNGNKSVDMNIVSGLYDGRYVMYHSNGKIDVERNYKAHEEEGAEKIYYESGQLKSDENYFYGMKNGICKYYNEKGILIKQENYLLDERQGNSIINDPVTGKLTKTILYVNDQPY